MNIKAIAAHEPSGKFEPFEYDPGALGPDEVEVDVTACGICHSDLSMLDFAARHDIAPKTEVFPMSEAAAALEHLERDQPAHRIVLECDF